MGANPAGVFVVRDELTRWLAQLDKPGREMERAFCLETWNGDGAFTVDRVGRGMVHADHLCMSLFGGIQPGRLQRYLSDALRDGPGDDGLLQRFQVLVWPDPPAECRWVDRKPDAVAMTQVQGVFDRLVALSAQEPLMFHFHTDAQELFVEYFSELQATVGDPNLHPALASHLAKYAS